PGRYRHCEHKGQGDSSAPAGQRARGHGKPPPGPRFRRRRLQPESGADESCPALYTAGRQPWFSWLSPTTGPHHGPPFGAPAPGPRSVTDRRYAACGRDLRLCGRPMLSRDIVDSLFPPGLPEPEHWERRYPPRELPEGAQVTRFSPSPTGFLHIGGVYAATIDVDVARHS